jgi:hypothetical protein
VKSFHRLSDSLEDTKLRDSQKLTFLKEKGITLIEVPYWWDRKYDSLQATIYNQRPDLFTENPTGKPIPLSPPSAQEKSKISSITSKYSRTNNKKIPQRIY